MALRIPIAATILLLLITTALRAQPDAPVWSWVDPYPTGQELGDVVVAPNGDLVAVGEHGAVFASTDRGATWRQRFAGDYRLLRGLAFATDDDGWAVGNAAVIRTTDGGASWRQVAIGHVGIFHDVAFASPEIGVIVGGADLAGKGVLRTTDAGETWSLVPLAISPTMTAAAFRDGVGLVVGHHGTIERTTDSGATWSVVHRDSVDEGVLGGVTFVADDVAIASGASGRILRSTDAGLTWTRVAFGGGALLHATAFFDSLRGVAVAEGGIPRLTTDGGVTWTNSAGGTSSRFAVAVVDSVTAWSVGYGGHISATTDAGRTWTVRSRGVGFPAYLDVDVDDDGRLLAVGEGGFLVVSDDDLARIRTKPTETRVHLHAVTWTAPGHFIAVGTDGTILRGNRGGDSIARVGSGGKARLLAVDISSDGIGYIAGSGTMLKTTDHGMSWTALASPTTDAIDGVDAVGDSVVWIVGRRGFIHRSTDGGATWEDRRSPTMNYLTAVRALDAERAFVVGQSGVAIHTSDGGLTWTFARIDENPSLTDIAFVDDMRAVAVGPESVAAVTTDGGMTWTRCDAPVTTSGAALVNFTGAAAYDGRVIVSGSAALMSVTPPDAATIGAPLADEPRGASDTRARFVDGALEIEISEGPAASVSLFDLLGRRIAATRSDVSSAQALRIPIDPIVPNGTYVVVVKRADVGATATLVHLP